MLIPWTLCVEYLCVRVECQSLAGSSFCHSLWTLLDCVLHKAGFHWHSLKYENYIVRKEQITQINTHIEADTESWFSVVLQYNGYHPGFRTQNKLDYCMQRGAIY